MTNDLEQIPFDNTVFAENSEPRCPVILLLDTSGSMTGEPINQLNQGIRKFKEDILEDSLATKRVELALITFGPVELDAAFLPLDDFVPPTLIASGITPIGEAIELAVDQLKHRKNDYKNNGIEYYRPWIFMITDGAPTDNYSNAIRLISKGEENKEFMFYAVGVDGCDMNKLSEISIRQPLKLKGLEFSELFAWLSSSLSSVSRSNPGDVIPLDNPATPDGWAVIE